MTTTQITFTTQADIDAEVVRLQTIIDTHQDQPTWAAAVELAGRRIDSLKVGRAGQLPLTIVT